MTLPGSTSNNGHSQQPKATMSIAEGADIQTEAVLSQAELAEIWAQRAYALAEEPPAPDTGQSVDLLVFWLNSERYGIEVKNVREIHPLEQLTPVPRTPDFVVGVFSARGRILSIVDLRAFFGLSASSAQRQKKGERGDQTKIIVVTGTNSASETNQAGALMEVGILADDVADVVTIFKEDIEPSLTTHTGARAEHLQGVTADMLVVLNLDTLLSDKRLIVHEEIM